MGKPLKIVHIVPGSGGTFYCENCMRDNALVQALRRRGHDVVMIPLYLPMFTGDGSAPADTPVFYGAISLYLKERFSLLRRIPPAVDRLLNARLFLKLAARKSGSTRAAGLEELTLSMLRGEEGRQAAELDHLIRWLKAEEGVDVVHLSNALLLGLARRIRSELNIPIVCSLQDEDTWVEPMPPDYAQNIWREMAERGSEVDAFTSVSRYYADFMSDRMRIPPAKLHIVPPGIELNGYEEAASPCEDTPVIGYLSRLTETLGLRLLVEAFIILKKDSHWRNLKLRVTGGRSGDDAAFVRALRRILKRRRVIEDFEIVSNFERENRQEFLRSLTVLSVPVPTGEAFGLYLLEAMAAGVPVVQPKAGAFPEVIEATGGGVIYEPNTAVRLAETLDGLLRDAARCRALAEQGRHAVHERFSIEKMAGAMTDVYRSLRARQ